MEKFRRLNHRFLRIFPHKKKVCSEPKQASKKQTPEDMLKNKVSIMKN